MKKSIRFHGINISYTCLGKGIPVLMLHGFAENSNIFKNILPDLETYLVLLPDLPGTRNSDVWPDENVTISDFAECILRILDEEGLQRVHFIGHSMGGYIAIEFANRYPERLSSLGFLHSSALADDEEKIETRYKAIQFIKDNGVSPFLQTSVPGLFKDPLLHQDIIYELLSAGEDFTPETLVQYYRAMIIRKDHALLLTRLEMPVLFIIGQHDKAVPFHLSLQQCYLAPISFVYILRDSAHMSFFEQPQKINIIINEFLGEGLSL